MSILYHANCLEIATTNVNKYILNRIFAIMSWRPFKTFIYKANKAYTLILNDKIKNIPRNYWLNGVHCWLGNLHTIHAQWLLIFTRKYIGRKHFFRNYSKQFARHSLPPSRSTKQSFSMQRFGSIFIQIGYFWSARNHIQKLSHCMSGTHVTVSVATDKLVALLNLPK